MKKLLFLLLFLIPLSFFAQAPQGINYQSIAYNSSNQIIINGNIRVRISVLDLTTTGTVLFQETHAKTTNANGLYSLIIGQGTLVSGSFTTIPWGNGSKFLKVELDPAGGTNYIASGTSQLMSVPYALYSENTNASTAIGNVANITALMQTIGKTDGDVVFVRGYDTDADGGGGNFIWKANSTQSDNGGTIIKPTLVSTGRWIRSYEGTAINVKWFGILGTTDDNLNNYTAKLTALINYFDNGNPIGIKLVFPKGVYRLKNIRIPSGFTISGEQGATHSVGYNASPTTIKPTSDASTSDCIFEFQSTTKNACLENLNIEGGFSETEGVVSINIKAAVIIKGEANRIYNNNIVHCYQHAIMGSINVSRIESNMMQGLYGRGQLSYGQDNDADAGYLGTLHLIDSSDNWIINNEIGGGIEYGELSSSDSKAVAFFGNRFHNNFTSGNIFENGDKAGFIMFSTRNKFTNNRYEFSNGNGLELVNNAQSSFINESFSANGMSQNNKYYDLVIGKKGNTNENQTSTLTFVNPVFIDGNNGANITSNTPKYNVCNYGQETGDWRIIFVTPYFSPNYSVNGKYEIALPARLVDVVD